MPINWLLVFGVGQFALTSIVIVGLWLYATGRTSGQRQQRQQGGQQSDGTRLAALEAAEVDGHQLRRDMTRDIGKIDVRLSKAEVRIDDQARRLDLLEEARKG